jgi:hypothetical protein
MVNEMYNPNVTIYRNMFDKGSPHVVKANSCLDRIRNGKSKETVEQIRTQLDKERAKNLKQNLPAVCWSGVFGADRTDKSIKEHSGLIVLDFDHVEDPVALRGELSKDPCTFAAWISPSGDGVKALFRVSDGSRHRELFAGIRAQYPLADPSGQNEARICFESYDPDLYHNPTPESWTTGLKTASIAIQEVVTDHSEIFDKLVKWMVNRGNSFTTGERNMFIFKLATACCVFGINQHSCESLIASRFLAFDTTFGRQEMHTTVRSAYTKNSSRQGTAEFSHDKLISKTERTEIQIDIDPDVYDLEVRPKDVIFGEDVKDAALSLYDVGYQKVNGIGIAPLDHIYRKRKTDLTLLTGIGNYGKSQYWKWYHLCRVLALGEKYAVFGPEDAPAEEYYFDFAEMILGCDLTPKNPDRPPRHEFERIYDFISKYVFYVYPKTISPSPKYIKERFLELVIKESVSGVLIDPFNQLANDYGSAGGRSDKYLETFLSDCSRFAHVNNVFFDIIAHPHKMRKDGNANYPCPDVFDVADGAMWNNKMDNILVYHRPNHQSDPMDATCELHSKKIRRQKTVGVKGVVSFEYNRKLRRFLVNGQDFIAEVMREDRTEQTQQANEIKSAVKPNTTFFVSSQDKKDQWEELPPLSGDSGEPPF